MIRASFTCSICQCHLTVLTAIIVPNCETQGNWLMCKGCSKKQKLSRLAKKVGDEEDEEVG